MPRPIALGDCTDLVQLVVVPKPSYGERTVFEVSGEGTVFAQGNESRHRHTCGSCDAPLMFGFPPGRVQGVVIGCNACGSYNDVPWV